MEFMVESVLQGMQHTAKGESELRGPNNPIHFQMVEAQPTTLEQSNGNIPVESALWGTVE
jgi:hypothetical protein